MILHLILIQVNLSEIGIINNINNIHNKNNV